jgi:multiple sugar transport system permease protein
METNLIKKKSIFSGYKRIYLLLIIYIIITLLPYAWLILTSFKTRVDSFSIPPKLLFSPTFDNYREAFIDKGFLMNLKNSIIVTSFSTFFALALGLPSAYAFSRFPIKGDKALFYYLLGTRFTPIVVLALPLYLIMSNLKLLDSYTGIIIAHVAFNLPFVVWMMKGFFEMIPREIDEAAIVDGCSWPYVFFKMAIPLSKSGIAATAVFCAVNSWNEFLMALILTGRNTATMPVAIPGLMTPQGTIWGQIAAVGTVITIPVLIFAIIIQKHMVKGMTMGAVK